MRDEETDRLGDQLQAAYVKSGMSPQDFTFWVYENREAAVDYEATPSTCSLTVIGDAIYFFYFTTRWFCKI